MHLSMHPHAFMHFQNLIQTKNNKNYRNHFHIIIHSIKNRFNICIMHSINKK